MKKLFKISGIALIVGLIAFLMMPSPSAFSTPIEDFPPAETIAFVPNEQNKGEKCLPATLYYSKSNGYTELGEGIVNPFCATLHKELKKSNRSGKYRHG